MAATSLVGSLFAHIVCVKLALVVVRPPRDHSVTTHLRSSGQLRSAPTA